MIFEPTTRARVTVTFLAMTREPESYQPLPEGVRFARVRPCSVLFYRYLYNNVGGDYLWWMRRAESDEKLAVHLAHHAVAINVLCWGEEPVGMAELDFRPPTTVNLSYFGLMKHAIGKGLGVPFLHAALQQAWSHRPRAVTVNTCNADHPRALPTYLKAGFQKQRSLDEIWDVPDRLGIAIPDRVRSR